MAVKKVWKRTKICDQVLTALSLAARDPWGVEQYEQLVVRAERIAKWRHSSLLGVKHVVMAAAKLGLLGGAAVGPEAGGFTAKDPEAQAEGVAVPAGSAAGNADPGGSCA